MARKFQQHSRRTRMARFVIAVAAITVGTIGAAIALNPAPAPQAVASAPTPAAPAPAAPEAQRPQPRMINIMGHENCAFVEVRRSSDGRTDQVRCLRKL